MKPQSKALEITNRFNEMVAHGEKLSEFQIGGLKRDIRQLQEPAEKFMLYGILSAYIGDYEGLKANFDKAVNAACYDDVAIILENYVTALMQVAHVKEAMLKSVEYTAVAPYHDCILQGIEASCLLLDLEHFHILVDRYHTCDFKDGIGYVEIATERLATFSELNSVFPEKAKLIHNFVDFLHKTLIDNEIRFAWSEFYNELETNDMVLKVHVHRNVDLDLLVSVNEELVFKAIDMEMPEEFVFDLALATKELEAAL